MIISWFSSGVSSAVATKLTNPDHIFYNHIEDQHPDTLRFIHDCEIWFGRQVEFLSSPLRTVNNACLQAAFLKGPHGAACSRLLKKRMRKEWELENAGRHTYIWGLDKNEKNRSEGFIKSMPDHDHVFPLIERGITKAEAHGMLAEAKIRRPAFYDEGYPNNNCIGCLWGGLGYWNRIRQDYPQVFKSRALLERKIGNSILKDCFLDELDENRGRDLKPIVADCGTFCNWEDNENHT